MKGYEYIIDYLRREIRSYYNRIRDINNVLSDTSNFFKALVNHDSNYIYIMKMFLICLMIVKKIMTNF